MRPLPETRRAQADTRMSEERLQRTLARAGFGSRRACEDLIREGRVTVNGEAVELGRKVDPGVDQVSLDGHLIASDPGMRYLMLNKPAGVLTTMEDPQGRATVAQLIPPGPRVFPVGRLDRDTEGLLLFTNDGELASRLMHPRYGVEKEYLAEVAGSPNPRVLARLREGVELEDGPARALEVRVVSESGGRTAMRVVMGEGRKREVRRLLASVDLPVTRLVRVRQGSVRLADIRPGEVRELTPGEVRGLFLAAGL